MTFRTKFLLFVTICVPPNNPITACGATSFPGHHSFPKWAIIRDFETRILRMVRVVYREWLRYVICNMEPYLALRDSAFFKHSCVRTSYSKEHLTCLFFGMTCDLLFVPFLIRARDPFPPTPPLCTNHYNVKLPIILILFLSHFKASFSCLMWISNSTNTFVFSLNPCKPTF